MNAPANIGTVRFHADLIQGSDEWLQARCGLLTASEMKLILKVSGGGTTTHYRTTGKEPTKPTPKRLQALERIGNRVGPMKDLAFLAEVSEGVLRDLHKDACFETIEIEEPRSIKHLDDDKTRSHAFELAFQRITRFVEPQYVSDAMLRGQEDEIYARQAYAEHYAPVTETGFVTNDRWGFTIGYSPDGLVGDDGLIEAKSRCGKYHVQTVADAEVPEDFMIQLQTGLLVSERKWIDFISYCGGLPMFVKRVEPDPDVQEAIIAAAVAFEQRVAEIVQQYHSTLASLPKLIPTERRVEQDIII